MKSYPLIIGILLLCLAGITHASHEHPVVKIHWTQTHSVPVQLQKYPLLAQHVERRVIERRQITVIPKARKKTLRDNGRHQAGSRKEAANITRQHYGGKVLKVDKAPGHYRVKVLRDGRVSHHNIPAK